MADWVPFDPFAGSMGAVPSKGTDLPLSWYTRTYGADQVPCMGPWSWKPPGPGSGVLKDLPVDPNTPMPQPSRGSYGLGPKHTQ